MRAQHPTAPASVEQWTVHEIRLPGPDQGNPFRDVQLTALFSHTASTHTLRVEGFYDGGGTYGLRFAPPAPGRWRFTTSSNAAPLDALTGEIDSTPPSSGNHGPVSVAHQYHFAHADGTPFRPLGTTLYNWLHQPHAQQDLTLRTLADAPFNKARMLVQPQSARIAEGRDDDFHPFQLAPDPSEPQSDPDANSATRDRPNPPTFVFSRPNPNFFHNLERRLESLLELGIQADVIFYHPYGLGESSYTAMTPEDDEFYLRYVVARLAAYPNVWWSLANEWDLLEHRPAEDWDRLCRLVADADPYDRLLSVHPHSLLYDYKKPWVSHISYQPPVTSKGLDELAALRAQYGKPLIVDELMYEGDFDYVWGSITGEEMVNRFWYTTVAGGYGTHGETFQSSVWCTVGGRLLGTSTPRLAFLQDILDDAPPLEPLQPWRTWRKLTAGLEGQYYLIYFGNHQPARLKLTLEAGAHWAVDIIDTWGMTLTPVEGIHASGDQIDLPRKPRHAVRIRRVNEPN